MSTPSKEKTKKTAVAAPRGGFDRALIGRESEWEAIQRALAIGKNVLIEGPVGVGKTHLVVQLLAEGKRPFERVDGDSRYTEQKLAGWFDPPLVLKQGYTADGFVEGPLLRAMRAGGVLFINELNRMPESVQNILLPAMDEKRIFVPKLGAIEAAPGFVVVATQNPREFTATQALSEALLDRFEMVRLGFQTFDEEVRIVRQALDRDFPQSTIENVVGLVRATRQHPQIRRGASVRSALSICELVRAGLALRTAVGMALPNRIELLSQEDDWDTVLESLNGSLDLAPEFEKKKN